MSKVFWITLYRASPIPAVGLEIPLTLQFECKNKETLDIMNGFVNSLYDWNYDGVVGIAGQTDSDSEDDTDFLVAISKNPNTAGDGTEEQKDKKPEIGLNF